MKIIIAILALLSTLLSGCATNSMTGRSQLILVSESAAISKSSNLYSSMIESYQKDSKLSNNAELNDRVLKITNRLVERAVLYKPDAQKWQWQVNVIESEEVNAFCMAGGKMAVYTGLLDKVNPTDDELAQVMGHEIAHALANHTAEKMSVDILTKIAVATATVAVVAADRSGSQQQRNNNQQLAQNAAAFAGLAFVTLPNSRGAETEADKLGIEIAAQAGYDPQASITLWEKMIAATDNKSRGDFFSTHPASPKRIEALEALQVPMRKIYDERFPLYANYNPSYLYVKSKIDSAGFSSTNVRVVTDGSSSLAEPNPVDSTQAMAFYSPEYESFKQGTLELNCKNCSLKFYLSQKDLKAMFDKKDWRGLVQNIIKIGYQFELSYRYLAAAADGLGFKEATKVYTNKAEDLALHVESSCADAKMIKCSYLN